MPFSLCQSREKKISIMLSGCTVLPCSKETELGICDQEASPSAGKNTGVV